MSQVKLVPYNESYIRIVCDRSLMLDIRDRLKFRKENYQYDPRVRRGKWDGFITLLDANTGLIYAGLSYLVLKICKELRYTVSIDDKLLYDEVSAKEVSNHVQGLSLPDWLDIRDYQLEAVVKCLRSRRRVFVSPTSSGKSLMMYFITTWYNLKTLIIVPSTSLVVQLKNDFISYGYKGVITTSVDVNIKDTNLPGDIVISTWQSISNGKTSVPEGWFDQFGVIIGDEAHTCQAKTLIGIMTQATNTKYKFGTTGSMPENLLDKHTIEGLFGPISTTISTKEMIERGFASKFKIKCLVIRYSQEDIKAYWEKRTADKSKDAATLYKEEVEYLIEHEGRNKFIENLALSLKGNKLVFFRRIIQGQNLLNIFKQHDLPVYYIDQTVEAEERELIRNKMEKEENAVLVASMKTTATGVSIKNLVHLIAAAPTKARITLLQSIGRMLRLHDNKTEVGATMYDIVDDLSMGTRENFAIKHFKERVRVYDEQEHDYKVYNIRLKNNE